ncbi:hypothetical protein P4U05_16970 [Bacillus paranthracis]|uniref:hypothetical protein n=1 Tax=Bacillus phage phi4B1 TaxID=1643324 RepID=UPI000200F422|nr:hypothetical protein [Bacillus paranthracis]YP_009206302.1 hypothetical protein XO26_0003 [Bacillus phage phi4B1]ADY20354.1 hypothetical protein YBT020_05540 [Bacillus thuringiensis serovar finitimus YBT-020]MRC72844.1 hypothetical protein [Bacillus thuringiensis]OTX71296.1 hypothetical protein BK722_12850 [Bacillus thuringiensis serovar finitimus]PGZ45706.1 hypothetical protein COE56_25840 [Bacillus anthracis]ALF02543.1 hypothetical protein XO26_0003 [Bacillus phage phi4B1]
MSYWQKVLLLSEKTLVNPYTLDRIITTLGSMNGTFNEVVEFFIENPNAMIGLLKATKLSFEIE